MKLVIVAGGKGTRLGLGDIPKPMAEIGGKPLLEQQILLARRYGISRIYILSGHLAGVIRDHCGDGRQWGVEITHVVEEEPLGTAGAVKLLENEIDERFLVFYGDVVIDMDVRRMIEFDSRQKSLATLLVHPNDHPYDSDLVETDASGRITAFLAKPHPADLFYRNLVNAGVYILDPAVFAHIPAGLPCDFGRDIFPALVREGACLRGYATPEYVKDMGTPDRFAKTRNDFASGKVARMNLENRRRAIFIDRDGVINVDHDNVCRVDEFELIDGVCDAIRSVNASEYLCIVVTNQPVLAKGFCTEDELAAIHRKMETLLGQTRAYVDALYFCPHHPERGFAGEVPELKIACRCRKPEPGLILQAAADFNIDLAHSYMIGDRYADIMAGINAGTKTILVKTGHGGDDKERYSAEADRICDTLKQAVDAILEIP